jgi:MATE family multidrug resistance protein
MWYLRCAMSSPSRDEDRSTHAEAPGEHPFVRHPHRTLLALALPVFASLVAEPITGLVDTAYVARLGSEPMAALGVATVVLSGIFWVFNFLGIGTQTEVAQAFGAGRREEAREICGRALLLAAVLGTLLAALLWPWLGKIASAMATQGETRDGTIAYLRIRLLGAPAVLATLAAMGALRGLQDMRTPLRIALATNAINLVLDPLLIFGPGPLPELGLAGAASASTIALWLGAFLSLAAVRARIGLPRTFVLRETLALLRVGGDLAVRTGSLMLFLVLATRTATAIGPESGAAHQAVRQVWMLTALALDAYAAAVQSLVGYFLGAGVPALARRAAAVALRWGVATGGAIAIAMVASERLFALLLVPTAARGLFGPAWLASALAQPLNAASFVTDGVHWATRDYRYLRNVMLLSTGVGALALAGIDATAPGALGRVWWTTAAWITVRGAFGLLRIWPGIGGAPLRPARRP